MVMIFVLRVPVTFEYSHDLHAKKNAPLMRSAMCFEKLSFLVNKCLSSMGVTAFCAFSWGSDRLNDFDMLVMWRCILPSVLSLGSG